MPIYRGIFWLGRVWSGSGLDIEVLRPGGNEKIAPTEVTLFTGILLPNLFYIIILIILLMGYHRGPSTTYSKSVDIF